MIDPGCPRDQVEAPLVETPAAEVIGRPLRIAVIGTPRSGNTWVRGLIGALYGLEELAVASRESLDWERLPERCIVQIHQYPEPDFEAMLTRLGVRVVVPARHPLDVMISALNYAQFIEHPPRWVDGSGNELTLKGASPVDREFLEYASNAQPGAILSISPAWWKKPGSLRIRFEDLVADPEGSIAGLASRIDSRILHPIPMVAQSFSIDSRRSNAQVWQYHFGMGVPGIWRELIPTRPALEIAERQREAFEILGYPCLPDPELSPIRAERNWYRFQSQLLSRHLEDERHRLAEARAELARARAVIEDRSGGSRADLAGGTSEASWRLRARCRLRRLWPR